MQNFLYTIWKNFSKKNADKNAKVGIYLLYHIVKLLIPPFTIFEYFYWLNFSNFLEQFSEQYRLVKNLKIRIILGEQFMKRRYSEDAYQLRNRTIKYTPT